MVMQTRRKSRRKRNVVSYYECDSDEDDEVMEEFDQDLAVAVAAKVKRARTVIPKSDTKFRFETVPIEILQNILSYVDNVRKVYQLSMMNKALRNAITPELVIRTAVFQGAQYSHAVDRLIDEISKKRIRVPSTFRMLRLVNAKSCERGKECFRYDAQQERTGALIGPSIRPFGMAICDPCLQALSAIHRSWYPINVQTTERYCTYGNKVLCFPQVEQATGEAIGPMVLFRDLQQINSYSGKIKEIEERFESTIKSATEQAFGPEDEERAERFIIAYEEAKSQYEDYQEAKRKIVLARQQAKAAMKAARKQELARPVFQQLKSQLSGYKYESLVLSSEWCSETGLCRFHHWPSSVVIGDLLSAPSTATRKAVLKGVANLKREYTKIEELGLFGGNFRSRFRRWFRTQNNIPKHQKALVRYFMRQNNPEAILHLSDSFDSFQMHCALNRGDRVQMILRTYSPSDCRGAFVHAIIRRANQNSRQKEEKLATYVWNNYKHYRASQQIPFDMVLRFGRQFDEAKSKYLELRQIMHRYQTDPDTQAWLNDDSISVSENFTRQDAIDTLYDGDGVGFYSTSNRFSRWRQHHIELVRAAVVSERDE